MRAPVAVTFAANPANADNDSARLPLACLQFNSSEFLDGRFIEPGNYRARILQLIAYQRHVASVNRRHGGRK